MSMCSRFLPFAIAFLCAVPLHAQRPVAATVDSARAAVEAAYAAYELQTREGVEESIAQFLKAAALFRSAGDTAEEMEALSNAGLLHNRIGQTDSAASVLRRVLGRAREAGDLAREASVLRQLGEVHHGLGRADSALAFYRQAARSAAGLEDRSELGAVLSNIGIAHRDLGALDSALHYLDRAIVLRRELSDTLGVAVTLNNLAAVEETLGRPARAITYLREALVLRGLLGDAGGEGNVLNNIGYNLELLGEPDSALHYYSRALPLLEQSGRQRVIGFTVANIGRALLTLGATDSARSTLRRALALKREEGDRAGEAWALNDLARVHEKAGQADSALHYYHDALTVLREIGDRAREGMTLFHLAGFHHRGRAEPDLARAVAYYDSAAAIRATVSRRTGSDANRIAFQEQDARLFADWALAWLARTPELGRESAAAGALAAAERGRAQALLDLMRVDDAAATQPARIAADLPAEGVALARGVAAADRTTLVYLLTLDSMVVWRVEPDGQLTATAVAATRDSVADLVGAWRHGIGAVSGARAATALAADRGIGLGRRSTIAPAAAVAALYDLALAGAEPPAGGELVIVPQGPLALLPFAALAPDTASPPLGASVGIRYAPSLGTLLEAEALTRSPPARAAGSALVVGNPDMPVVAAGTVPLPPLPGAEREAVWLAEQLGVTPLTGAAATETAVLERFHAAGVVHLATHGFAFDTDSRARDSFLAFAPGAGEDGLLTVGDVLDRAPVLAAELVVLSACQTGLGDLTQAEGTVGLQRAFLARGARSVLVSLWNVSDEATDALMRAFYTHWLHDLDAPAKAEALRRAQEDVRAMNGFSDPRYWAAFQLVGAQ